ncbi:uncharacterized protein LOC34617408 [Cyclospora cayetanensis]|uniref:Uncharacterized protein LOC34617408 n=1 Tax=Cyclospora cayetanensis TaxID=88456 RepID=A0A6P6RTP3_9EIME|nr:uncharacterized protein LOC34617408 [Cyclospora cayetanensis]
MEGKESEERQTATAARWWLSLLEQSPGIDVVYLWCRRREAAESLMRSPEGSGLQTDRVVWGDGENTQGRKSLKAIVLSQRVDSFIIAASPEMHAELLETLFSIPQGREKHVFSCTPPSYSFPRMQRLVSQYGDSTPRCVWAVCSSFIHEVAAAKVKAILLDLGQLVAAQVNCTSLLQNQAVAECGNANNLLKSSSLNGKPHTQAFKDKFKHADIVLDLNLQKLSNTVKAKYRTSSLAQTDKAFDTMKAKRPANLCSEPQHLRRSATH